MRTSGSVVAADAGAAIPTTIAAAQPIIEIVFIIHSFVRGGMPPTKGMLTQIRRRGGVAQSRAGRPALACWSDALAMGDCARLNCASSRPNPNSQMRCPLAPLLGDRRVSAAAEYCRDGRLVLHAPELRHVTFL